MRKGKMVVVLFMLLSMALLTACNDNNKVDKLRDYYVLEMETEIPFSTDTELQYLGAQYYMGEPVHLNAMKNTDENLMSTLDIYVYKTSGEKELLLSDVSVEYQRQNWYLGVEGDFFVWSRGELKRLGEDGTELFRRNMGGVVWDVCQLPNGKVYLLLEDTENEKMKISEISLETGEVDETKSIYLEYDKTQYISNDGDKLLLMNANGIYEVNTKDNSKTMVFPFTGSNYELQESAVSDFCVTDDGGAEVLRRIVVQKLSRVNIADTRKILFYRDNYADDFEKKCIEQFNKENQEYYVALDTRAEDVEYKDYLVQSNLQLMAESADIISMGALSDAYSLYEKGVFEDLSPYMEQSGMLEEDYFPVTFEFLRDGEKIYTVYPFIQLLDFKISKELLGEQARPDIETLVEALKNYDEEAVFDYWESEQLLDYLLSGSEDLWGMIDWENGSCDFSGELFAELLEVSKRYGWTEQSTKPILLESRIDYGIYSYELDAELEAEGMVPVGWIFEDGGHITITGYEAMAMNSGSPYKEGVWEFMYYMLTEGQSMVNYRSYKYSASKEAYRDLVAHEIEEGSILVTTVDGNSAKYLKGRGDTLAVYKALDYDDAAYRAIYDMTWERGNEVMEHIEDIHLRPVHTKPILEIVCEEACSYFYGNKSIEEVVAVIENRVQLYLDEKS